MKVYKRLMFALFYVEFISYFFVLQNLSISMILKIILNFLGNLSMFLIKNILIIKGCIKISPAHIYRGVKYTY